MSGFEYEFIYGFNPNTNRNALMHHDCLTMAFDDLDMEAKDDFNMKEHYDGYKRIYVG